MDADMKEAYDIIEHIQLRSEISINMVKSISELETTVAVTT
jgi:hypothetical protein